MNARLVLVELNIVCNLSAKGIERWKAVQRAWAAYMHSKVEIDEVADDRREGGTHPQLKTLGYAVGGPKSSLIFIKVS